MLVCVPADEPCAGRSSAATKYPARPSGATKEAICAAQPSQPWASRTVGPSPQSQTARSGPPSRSVKPWVVSGGASGIGDRACGRGRVKRSAASRPAARGATASRSRKPTFATWIRAGMRCFWRTPRAVGAGESESATADRPVVLFSGEGWSMVLLLSGSAGSGSGSSGLEQPRKGVARAPLRLRIAQQPPRVVEAEHDAVELERELLDVESAAQVALGDRDARRLCQGREQLFLEPDQHFADRTFAVVQLGGGGHHQAAAGQLGCGGPAHPVLEERAQARQPARLAEGRKQYGSDEAARAGAQHVDLQLFPGMEVREQPALRHPELLRDVAQAQALEPFLRGHPEGRVEDAVASLGAFAAHGSLFTTGRAICQARDRLLSKLLA